MPDDQTTTQSSQAASQSQSASGDQTAASNSSQATAGDQTQQTTQQQATTRPDWAPETVWDPATNSFKPDALKAAFEESNTLKAFKAAEDSKRLSLPKDPNEYKLALPKDWKAPEGIEFKLDETDPLFTQAREWAHKNGLSQDAFESGLAMLAASKVGDVQFVQNAKNAEIGKLGPNGPARVTAVTTWMDAKGYGALKPMLVTEAMVKTFEKLMADVTGGGTFSQQHRDTPPEADKIPGIEKMNFRQARAAQDAHAARLKQN